MADAERIGKLLLEHHQRYPGLAVRDLQLIIDQIDGLLASKSTVRVAIDGFCGSGKSVLASFLQRVYHANVIKMDHFFLPRALRTPERLAEPGGNVDYERFLHEVVPGLLTGSAIQYQVFNCQTMMLEDMITIPQCRLIIVEGSYSMHPRFGDPYDLRIFLQIDPEEQIRRILHRAGPILLERFIQEWIPMENRYFTAMNILEKSDLILCTKAI